MTHHPKRDATTSQSKREAVTTTPMAQPDVQNQTREMGQEPADRRSYPRGDYLRNFDFDAPLAARHTLIDKASHLASSATPDSAVAHARVGIALYAIAESGTDDQTRGEVVEAMDRSIVHLASAPAQTLEDVQAKLAGLVLELVRFADGSTAINPTLLMLASCALADLVILGPAPAIPLPHRAFERIDNPEIIDHWRHYPNEKEGRV